MTAAIPADGVISPKTAKRGAPRSLLLRIALAQLVLLGALGLALFVAVDHLITREVGTTQQERTQLQSEELRRLLDSDLRQISGQAVLAATDSDLIHSTHYHVRLRGEAKAAQQDVERIAQTLALSQVVLHREGGGIVAARSDGTAGDLLALPLPSGVPGSVAVWDGERLWVVAETVVSNETIPLARLRVARTAALPLSRAGGDTVRAVPMAAVAGAPSPASAQAPVIATVLDTTGASVRLEVLSADRSVAILDRAKSTLAWIFLIGCAAAAAIMVLVLRREIAPLEQLTRAAEAVGRGEFGSRVVATGTGEIAALATAFNSMAEDLGRLRGLERQLREQEKIAAIGRLATRLAHDINNPLTVIKNAALLLRRRADLDATVQQDLQLIVHHCGRCATILENLLLFGRPLRLRVQTLDLNSFCEGVVERARLRQSDGRWTLRQSERPVKVEADAQQLEQLLENLLNNAYDAARGEPIELSCGLRDGRPFIQVSDRGAGFSPEAKGHLFELFYTTKKHGSGIGLANASAIARAHGGDLIIENAGGAVVRLELPENALSRVH